MKVLPSEGNANMGLLRLRPRYVFALLESGILTMQEPLARLRPSLEKNNHAVKAARCIRSSLDKMSGNYADFIGHWAWDELVCPLSKDNQVSTTMAFIGRPSNPDRSPIRSFGLPETIDEPPSSRADEQTSTKKKGTTSSQERLKSKG